jgi:hypothetical protein
MDKMMEEVANMHESMAKMRQGITDMHQGILSLAHANSLSHAQAIERIDQLAAQVLKDPDSRAKRVYSRAYGAYRAHIPARCPCMQRLS